MKITYSLIKDQLVVQIRYEVTLVKDPSNVGLLSNITYVTK
jgi:hypothetical protein